MLYRSSFSPNRNLSVSFFLFLSGSYAGGWVSKTNDLFQFLQVDLGNVTTVTVIATQGHSVNQWWVKTYTLDYKKEDENFTAYGQAST